MLTVTAWAGCTVRQSGDDADDRIPEDRPWLRAVRSADQFVVYEGLPHQYDERKLLDKERAAKETLILHDFPFYAAPLDVAADDRERLRGALGEAESFRPWRGEKKCGGFHPDYLAEWRAGSDTYQVLICFGCREVNIYVPGLPAEGHRVDLAFEVANGLGETLGKYRKNRPVDPGTTATEPARAPDRGE